MYGFTKPRAGGDSAFTLIELLIVVAIIAILAAIAVPNFLEAQTRSKVSRVKSDLRSVATGIESYRVDHNEYPEGTDNVNNMSPELVALFGPLAPGYYAMRTRGSGGLVAGLHFHTLTTPVAYIATMPDDTFAQVDGVPVAFAYRNAKDTKDGWILTSVGPDTDLLAPDGRGNTNTANPLSTAADGNSPARLADINERGVIHFIEGTGGTPEQRALLDHYLTDLSYDPTNGTISDGDIFRMQGVPR
jgi:prepilin-type N-terminal cleavage/methylation domain-containing protein